MKKTVEFKRVVNECQIAEVASLGRRIWREHYLDILGIEQIEYMLEKFQSEKAVASQIKDGGYMYFIIECGGKSCGYIGISADKDRLFLSKLYIKKEFRSMGIASKAIAMLEDICKNENLKAIWLTVNRYNTNSKAVYEKKGFRIIDEQVNDIGSGYVMDDYIMQKDL